MATAALALVRPWPVFRSFVGYQASWIGSDLIAGLTLAAIAIPEQMATAKLGSMPPQVGFFAFIAATLGFLIFGAGRQTSVGADSTITPIFAGALVLLAAAGTPGYLVLASGLALMVGGIIVIAGLLKMGWIGNLLSAPVTTGFLAGIAIHIFISQLPAALGLPPIHGEMVEKTYRILQSLGQTNAYDLAIAAGVFILIATSHAISGKLPGALVAVVLATGATMMMNLDGAHNVGVLGHVQGGLPAMWTPPADPAAFLAVLPLALLVALIAMVQTAAVARSFPEPGMAPDVDADLIGLGAANLFAGFLGAFPVNASPPRTAIVAESGARSQMAGLAAVAATLALLVFGTSLLTRIPHAALAGVLLFVATRIFRIGDMRKILAASPLEALFILVTAAAIVILPIAVGVALGVGLSLLQGAWTSARMRLRPMHLLTGSSVWWLSKPGEAPDDADPAVAVFAFQAPLSFLNADGFHQQVLAVIQARRGALKLIILEAAGILDVDFTAAAVFKDAIARSRAAGVDFAVARLESEMAQRAFARLGLNAALGAGRIFPSVAEAVKALSAKG